MNDTWKTGSHNTRAIPLQVTDLPTKTLVIELSLSKSKANVVTSVAGIQHFALFYSTGWPSAQEQLISLIKMR